MIPVRGPAEHGWRLVDQRVETPVGTWRIVLALPGGPLARRVEAVWTAEGQGCFEEEEILPRTRTEVGLTPKAFARVARFESAFERLNQLTTVRWAEFALDFGYADQAHLVHDFNELAGASPTEVFRRRAPDGLGLLNEHDAATMLAAPAPGGAQARS